MSQHRWNLILKVAKVAFIGEAWVCFSLYFAPGWANDWPFGLTIHKVWSTGMAALFFLMTVTLAIGIGAGVGAYCVRFEVGRRHGGCVYFGWLVLTVTTSIALSYLVYGAFYASTLRMWPNGYP